MTHYTVVTAVPILYQTGVLAAVSTPLQCNCDVTMAFRCRRALDASKLWIRKFEIEVFHSARLFAAKVSQTLKAGAQFEERELSAIKVRDSSNELR